MASSLKNTMLSENFPQPNSSPPPPPPILINVPLVTAENKFYANITPQKNIHLFSNFKWI